MNGDLTRDFSSWEFECKCGCGTGGVSDILVHKLQELRYRINAPITITSGTRCPSHNKAVGGEEFSSHLVGVGADIVTGGDIRKVYQNIFHVFSRVGIYTDGHFHVDVDPRKKSPAIWVVDND